MLDFSSSPSCFHNYRHSIIAHLIQDDGSTICIVCKFLGFGFFKRPALASLMLKEELVATDCDHCLG